MEQSGQIVATEEGTTMSNVTNLQELRRRAIDETLLRARSRMAAPSRPVKIEPAATGRAAPKERRWLDTSTAKGYAMMQPRARGIRRTHHAGRMAAAAKPTSAAPAAMGCSIALPPTGAVAVGYAAREGV